MRRLKTLHLAEVTGLVTLRMFRGKRDIIRCNGGVLNLRVHLHNVQRNYHNLLQGNLSLNPRTAILR